MRDVIIYPSSWYYNACVQGFLEVIAWGLGEKGNEIIEEKILQDDGTAVIPGELMKAVFSTRELKVPDGYTFEEVPDDICELKRIGWWWVEKSSLINWRNFDTDKIDDEILLLIFENYLQGKGLKPIAEILNNAGYQTLDNKKWKEDDVGKVVSTETNYNRIPQKHTAIIEFVFRQLFSNNKIYQNLYNLNSHKEKIKFLNKWFSVNGKGDYYCSFCNSSLDIIFDKNINSQFLTLEISKLFGNSINEFPNSFWDNSPQYLMCRFCRSYFIFFHIIQHNNFFINSDSLKVNWHLNHLIRNSISAGVKSRQRTLMEAINYDPQLRKTVGGWGLQNLEVLLFQLDKVDSYYVSANLARLLMVPQISSLVTKISNNKVLDLVLTERFDYLTTIIYKSLRAYLSKNDNTEDPEIIKSVANESKPINDIIDLFLQIKTNLNKGKGGAGVRYIDLKEIRKSAIFAPIKLTDNKGKNIVYRLLELTRLNKKNDVYHLLLRIYISNEKEFPESLAKLFEIKDSELFKTGIYAFIAGLDGTEQNKNKIDGMKGDV